MLVGAPESSFDRRLWSAERVGAHLSTANLRETSFSPMCGQQAVLLTAAAPRDLLMWFAAPSPVREISEAVKHCCLLVSKVALKRYRAKLRFIKVSAWSGIKFRSHQGFAVFTEQGETWPKKPAAEY